MNRRRLLARLQRGQLRNVGFSDLVDLAEGFGFGLERIRGRHHIFHHPTIRKSLNLQEADGQAKPYQIRQLLDLVARYNLELEARACRPTRTTRS